MTGVSEPSNAEVIDVYRRLLDAWNRRDADGFAALFAETGSTVGFDGSQMDGRSAIAAALRQIFADHPTAAYVARIREVRRIAPAVRLVRAVVGMVPPGKATINPAVNAIQSVLIVLESSRLRVALLHNTPAAFHGRSELNERLTAELVEVFQSGTAVDEGGR